MVDKVIEIIKYIIIGIVQGISEILPISSSGHLSLTYKLLDISKSNQLDITIYLHFASSIALCLFFKDKIKDIIRGCYLYIFKKDKSQINSFKLLIYLILATIPAAITGLLFDEFIEANFNNSLALAICFFITSIILLISSRLKKYTNSTYTFKNTIVVGLFQCLAIFPGISRSGTTMFAANLSKLDSNKQKEFSFLLLIPISLGAFILSLIKSYDTIFCFNESSYLYLISMIVSFILTFLSLKILMKKIKNIPYVYFSIYLLILSVIILFFYYL